MRLQSNIYVLVFGKHFVIFDYSKFIIIPPEASADELEQIQNSTLYRYFEDDLTDKYCKLFGIDRSALRASC